MLKTILLAAFVAQTPLSGSGIIQGIVCEVQTCKPIAGARVFLAGPGPQSPRRAVVTDFSGNFRLDRVAAGRYQLTAEADNFTASGFVPLITVTDGSTVQSPKIEMRALGTISGQALDEAGRPLTGARVEALAFRPQNYFRMLMPVSEAETDDRGEFRISSLEPDEYYVRILPPIDRHVKEGYPITYYPNTTDPASAAKIVISAGMEAAAIDPRLSSRGVKVRGRIVNVENESRRVTVVLLPRSPSVFVMPFLGANTSDETNDDFEIRGVAPGSYYLYAVANGGRPFGLDWVRWPLDVADKDVENLKIPIVPSGSITGKIGFAPDAIDADKLDLSKIRVNAGTTEIVPGTPRVNVGANVSRTGDFQFPHLSEMKLFLSDQLFNDSWFISSVTFEGSDAIVNGFSGTPGKESLLQILISNASGTFAGIIKDQQEKPVPAGRVVLLPERSFRANPFLTRTGVAIEKGQFTIETIPPGDYIAIALPDEDQFTPAFLRDLQSVEKYERFGLRVHIAAREVTRLDLTVAPSQ